MSKREDVRGIVYDLSLEDLITHIREANAKRVCIQLPDGLKPRAGEIVDAVRKALPNVDILIWAGSNFGACDLPLEVKRLGVDLLIHYGHDAWVY